MLQPSRLTQRCVSEGGVLQIADQVPLSLALAASWAWSCLAVVAVSDIYLSERRTDLPWLSWPTHTLLLLACTHPHRPWSLEPSWGTTPLQASTRHAHTPTSNCSSGWRRCRTRAGPLSWTPRTPRPTCARGEASSRADTTCSRHALCGVDMLHCDWTLLCSCSSFKSSLCADDPCTVAPSPVPCCLASFLLPCSVAVLQDGVLQA